MLLPFSIIPALLIALIQWRFSQLTGSLLLGYHALLQLVLTIVLSRLMADELGVALLFRHRLESLRPAGQLLLGLLVLLASGYLINECYVRWYEQGHYLASADALPVIWLSVGGHSLLWLIGWQGLRSLWQRPWHGKSLLVLVICSVTTALFLLLAHLTGWQWIDWVVAATFGTGLALLAIGFMLDAYWVMAEMEA